MNLEFASVTPITVKIMKHNDIKNRERLKKGRRGSQIEDKMFSTLLIVTDYCILLYIIE